MDFKLNRLVNYDDNSLLEEVRRVAIIVKSDALLVSEFKKHACVDIGTLRNRFGTWKSILEAAELSHLYKDGNRKRSKRELVQELKRVASEKGEKTLTVKQFELYSCLTIGPYMRVFGSWLNALEAAGLQPVPRGKRYSEEECYENLLSVWTHYGRAPKYKEMSLAPSHVGSKAYVNRWGIWAKALYAFVEYVGTNSNESGTLGCPQKEKEVKSDQEIKLGRRDIPLGMRYNVLVRGQFRCKICGRSPATHIGLSLHIDHIFPWSKGGATSMENLRVLCDDCNLGKGAKIEDEI